MKRYLKSNLFPASKFYVQNNTTIYAGLEQRITYYATINLATLFGAFIVVIILCCQLRHNNNESEIFGFRLFEIPDILLPKLALYEI